jgi:hypothetical protein
MDDIPWQKLQSVSQQIGSSAKFTGDVKGGVEIRESLIRLTTDLCRKDAGELPASWEVWIFLLKTLLCEKAVSAPEPVVASMMAAIKEFRPQKGAEGKVVNLLRKDLPTKPLRTQSCNVAGLPCKLPQLCAFCSQVVGLADTMKVGYDVAFSVFGKEAGHGHFAHGKIPFNERPLDFPEGYSSEDIRPLVPHKLAPSLGPKGFRSRSELANEARKAETKEFVSDLEAARKGYHSFVLETAPAPSSPSYCPRSPEPTPSTSEPETVERCEEEAQEPSTPMERAQPIFSLPPRVLTSEDSEPSGTFEMVYNPRDPPLQDPFTIPQRPKRDSSGEWKPPSPTLSYAQTARPSPTTTVRSENRLLRRPKDKGLM